MPIPSDPIAERLATGQADGLIMNGICPGLMGRAREYGVLMLLLSQFQIEAP